MSLSKNRTTNPTNINRSSQL